jgi:eukaryotic-like serine/threonine-protein kinase
MPLTTVAALLETLRQVPLLEGRRLNEVVQFLEAHQGEPLSALLPELVARGWLTGFQLERLITDQAASLLLGQYVLLDRLGTGGMGKVFKARHRRLERVDAVKVIRPDLLGDPEAVARFQREARAAAKLSHPNLITVYDFDRAGDVYFLAMEYIEGTDLSRLVAQQGKLPASDACEYIRQAALGLQHAHEQGLVHRDIKPENLLVVTRNNAVKVLDLGLARIEHPADADGEFATELVTEQGATMGTWDYLAPEQAEDAHRADIRSDIYSLGCTFYHLLAGQAPFAGYAGGQKLVQHRTAEPKLIEDFRPDLPFGLGAVLRKMMAKAPEDRYQTPAEVADALYAYSQESVLTSDVPMFQQQTTVLPEPEETSEEVVPPPPPRRTWLLAAGGVVIIVVLALGLAAWRGWLGRTKDTRPTPREGPAPQEFINSLGMRLVRIKPDTFVMGSPQEEKGRNNDEDAHPVTITRPFYLGVFEVTQAEYEQLMGTNPSWFSARGGGRDLVKGQDTGRFPVDSVTWQDAVAFCDRLSKAEPGRHYRLPTEAEWEYACRAGTATPFNTGPLLRPDQANFLTAPPTKTSPPPRPGPVDQYPSNAWGLFAMHGNVREWCADVYDEDAYQRPSSPKRSGKESRHVCRGGAYLDTAALCRSAARGAADQAYPFIGFRGAADLDEP